MGHLKILHVEDDAELAAGVAQFLGGHGHAVTAARSGGDALALLDGQAFDVIVLDRMLPDMNGIQLLRAIRERGCRRPALMLSALGRSVDRVDGLDAGVDDYLAKPYDPHELIARIRALHRRATEPDRGALITFGSLQCHPLARTVYRHGEYMALSPKEYNLLRYFLDHADEVVTRKMLLKDIWKLDFDPQTNVIDVSISRLRRKIELGDKGPTIETVWGHGYRLVMR